MRSAVMEYLSLVQISCPALALEISQLGLQGLAFSLAAPQLLACALQAHLTLPFLRHLESEHTNGSLFLESLQL